MSFLGKKWKKVEAENFIEFLDALKLSDKIRSLLRRTESLSSWSKNADGTYTYRVEAGGEVLLDQTFTLGKEQDFNRPDGVVTKMLITLEGDTLKQSIKDPEGKSVYLERTFSGDTMKLKATADGVDVIAYVNYQAV